MDCKIKGIVCPNLNVDFFVGLHWLRQLKPVIDWESSVITVPGNDVNYKIHPYRADYRMKDFIFVCLVETKTLQSLTLTLANLKVCIFCIISTETKLDIPIIG